MHALRLYSFITQDCCAHAVWVHREPKIVLRAKIDCGGLTILFLRFAVAFVAFSDESLLKLPDIFRSRHAPWPLHPCIYTRSRAQTMAHCYFRRFGRPGGSFNSSAGSTFNTAANFPIISKPAKLIPFSSLL